MKYKKILTIAATLVALAFCASPQAHAQFTGANVGTPALAGSAVVSGGDITITGGGDDIWNASDNFYYYYKTVNSPVFDAIVEVKSLEGPDAWTKCELMLRVPDSTGTPKGPDPFLALMTTRTNGQNQVGPQWRVSRAGNADWTAMGLTVRPVYQPTASTWLRIQRVGSLFTLSYSNDGVTWTKYGDVDTWNGTPVGGDQGSSFTTPLPDKLLVGVAVTAHNDTDITGGIAIVSNLAVTETSPPAANLTAVTQVTPATASPYTVATFTFSATNSALANGMVGSYQWQRDGVAIAGATSTKFNYMVGPGDAGAQITCKASAYGGATLLSSAGTITLGPSETRAGVKYEVWDNPDRNRAYIESFTGNPANRKLALTDFEIPVNRADNFGDRLSAVFTAPATTNYVFYIAADDDADFFISTDVEPRNKRLVCQELTWSGSRSWITAGDPATQYQKTSQYWSPDGGATQPYFSGIPLVAGQKYYIEAAHHEGGGGDNLAVTFKYYEEPDPLDGDAPRLVNAVLSYGTLPVTAPGVAISQQPTNTTVYEAQTATFRVGVTFSGELTPTYQWQREGVDIPGATGSSLSFIADLVDNAKKYKVLIGLPGTAYTATSDEATLTVTAVPFINGLVKRELWLNNITSRAAVEAGTAPAPTQLDYINRFDDENLGDNYVQRLSTWFVAPVSGQYVFFVSSDDDSDLFVSTSEKPADKVLVAQESTWTGTRNWLGDAERRSDQWIRASDNTVPWGPPNYIPLIGGQKYYIEMVHHEGGGGDNAAATFSVVNSSQYPDPAANGDATRLAGNMIGIKAPAPTRLSVSTQPQSVSVPAWSQATFTVAASTDAIYPPTYQWQKNGVNVAGATGTAFSVLCSTNDSGNQYRCIVSLAAYGTPATSDAATLTVTKTAVFNAGKLNDWRYGNAGSRANVEIGNVGEPSYVGTLPAFQSPVDIADNYVRRLGGIFVAPETGPYVFWVCGDDDIDLFVSTDDQPANKKLVAQETAWSGALAWVSSGGGSSLSQKRSDQWSPDNGVTIPYQSGITLQQGGKYYIEAIHSEGGGGDSVSATFHIIGSATYGTEPVDLDPSRMTGSMIGYMAAPAAPRLAVSYTGGSVSISWAPGGGTLYSSPVLGPAADWQPVGTANPTVLAPSAASAFFRVGQ